MTKPWFEGWRVELSKTRPLSLSIDLPNGYFEGQGCCFTEGQILRESDLVRLFGLLISSFHHIEDHHGDTHE